MIANPELDLAVKVWARFGSQSTRLENVIDCADFGSGVGVGVGVGVGAGVGVGVGVGAGVGVGVGAALTGISRNITWFD